MNLKEHRLYSYMSEPMRFIGLTIDEIGLGLMGLLGFTLFDNRWAKLACMTFAPLSVYSIKKAKSVAVGFSLVSFLHWHLGIRFDFPSSVPASWKRTYLG